MKLHEEFKEYENMWNSLNEWVDQAGNKVGSSTSGQAVPAPTSPIAAKKRKQVKNKFGILMDSWREEFKKLARHIYQVNGQPADLKDGGIADDLLRLYFIVKSGEEWRLEITTTKVSMSRTLQMREYWDYVLSTYRNGSEVIISRGHVQNYNALLDVLIKEGVITDKSKCI